MRLPNGITELDNISLANSALTTIELPNSVICVGSSAFYNCKNLTYVKLNSSLLQIKDGAFLGCLNIKSIYIPESLQSIGDYVFVGCPLYNYTHKLFQIKNSCVLSSDGKALLYMSSRHANELYIPDGIEAICASAFYSTIEIKQVIIPDSVKFIGFHTFEFLKGTKIYYKGTIHQWEQVTGYKPRVICIRRKQV